MKWCISFNSYNFNWIIFSIFLIFQKPKYMSVFIEYIIILLVLCIWFIFSDLHHLTLFSIKYLKFIKWCFYSISIIISSLIFFHFYKNHSIWMYLYNTSSYYYHYIFSLSYMVRSQFPLKIFSSQLIKENLQRHCQ